MLWPADDSIAPGAVDLLVLPEMALSGYMFATPSAILPYLEQARVGPTSVLATALAARLRCYVVAGYPESIPDAAAARNEVEAEGLGVGWNSAVLAAPNGTVVGNYRKTFRFETDKTWAREGDGFAFFDLPEPLGRVAIGICMGGFRRQGGTDGRSEPARLHCALERVRARDLLCRQCRRRPRCSVSCHILR